MQKKTIMQIKKKSQMTLIYKKGRIEAPLVWLRRVFVLINLILQYTKKCLKYKDTLNS